MFGQGWPHGAAFGVGAPAERSTGRHGAGEAGAGPARLL